MRRLLTFLAVLLLAPADSPHGGEPASPHFADVFVTGQDRYPVAI